MCEEGWVKLYRKLKRNWCWPDDGAVFTKLEAWIDILLTVDRRDHKDCPPGHWKISVRFLAKRWNWTTKRVHVFLRKLVNSKTIRLLDQGQDGQVLVVKNWGKIDSVSNVENVQIEGNTKGNTQGNTETPATTAPVGSVGNTKGNTKGNKEQEVLTRQEEYKAILEQNAKEVYEFWLANSPGDGSKSYNKTTASLKRIKSVLTRFDKELVLSAIRAYFVYCSPRGFVRSCSNWFGPKDKDYCDWIEEVQKEGAVEAPVEELVDQSDTLRLMYSNISTEAMFFQMKGKYPQMDYNEWQQFRAGV